MARPAPEDDRRAVLRRLERHAVPDGSRPESARAPAPKQRRPSVSLRLVLGVLALMAVTVIVLWAPWETAPTTFEVPPAANSEPVDPPSRPETSPPPAPPPETQDAAATAPAHITINVVGHVTNPGVHTLPEGARVIDAIEAAGGATKTADLTRLNLARVVSDEEYLAVLATGEDPPELLAPNAPATAGGAGSSAGQGGENQPGGGGVLNLNTATQDQLQSLPGVGPVMAGRIVAWREENDGFRSVDELHEISGVGPKVFAQLAPLVTI